MVYGPRKIKKSQFTGGTVSNSSTLDFVKNGINQKQEWSGFLADIAEVFGASFRVYEFTSELVASDIALGEYALVEETSYGLYKITSNAATGNDIALDSGFTATWENQLGGFVIGPASSTDDAVALYDGTSGALLKDGPAISSLALASDVSTNTAAIAANAATISTNSTNIATNSTNITNNTDEISRINSKEVADYAEALALTPADYEAGEIIYVTGDGIAGPFKVVASAISASSTGVQLSNATWNAAGKHLKRVFDSGIYVAINGLSGIATEDLTGYSFVHSDFWSTAGDGGHAKLYSTGGTTTAGKLPTTSPYGTFGDSEGNEFAFDDISVVTSAAFGIFQDDSLDALLAQTDRDSVVIEGGYTTTSTSAPLRTGYVGDVTINSIPMSRTRYIPCKPISRPSGFPGTLQLDVYQTHTGEYKANVDLWAYELASKNPSAVVYWVDIFRGSDANTGLDPDAPKASLGNTNGVLNTIIADTVSDAIIYVRSGVYDRNRSWNGIAPDANITVICEPGTWLTTREPPGSLSWSLDGAGTYTATRSAVDAVIDCENWSEYGTPERLTGVGSVAECQATASTFYTDGADVWVHRFNGETPDDKVMVILNTTNGRYDHNGKTIYVKGARFYGGNGGAFATTATPASASDRPTLLFEDCDFAYAYNGNGVTSIDARIIISKNCRAYQNDTDGFNYHENAGFGSQFIEYNCEAFDNGWLNDTGDNFNGSTGHEAAYGIRINTRCRDNQGPQFADVGDCKTWNLGCSAFDSGADPGIFNAAYLVNDDSASGDATMWLDGCSSDGCDNDIVSQNATNTVYVRNWNGGLTFNDFDGGAISSY